jgi:hypothetical protein
MYNHGVVNIGVAYDGMVDINNCGVIPECMAFPSSAIETIAAISIAIIYAAIKTNMESPVSGIKTIYTACKSPVAGCP